MSIYSTNLHWPLIFIALSSAAFLSGGVQSRKKKKAVQLGIELKPFDSMFWTNLDMTMPSEKVALYFIFILHTYIHTYIHYIHTYIHAHYEVNNYNLPYI